jgi:hypothetical protein
MEPLLIETPLNSLSFGNVSINILRELHKLDANIGLFPMGEVKLQAHEINPDFQTYLKKSIDQRFDFLSKDIKALKLWHLNGADNRKNPHQLLYSFYECNKPTDVEVAIANAQNTVAFSSTYARDQFNKLGVDAKHVPVGFDETLVSSNEEYFDDSVTHFVLMGKFEKRKHTAKIIQTWVKKYGNDSKFLLTCCVTNPFVKEDEMRKLINDALGNEHYTNVNFLPYLNTNIEVNDLLNSADIDLTGLSGGEGWNLPSFNATALGKWSVVLNATSHKDWATAENSILVEPHGEISVADNMFFQEGNPFNQGSFYSWKEDAAIAAMETAISKSKTVNTEGLKLQQKFSYKRTTDELLKLL